MTFSRLHISVFIALAALVWWIVLLIQGTPVGWDHLRPFSIVVGLLVLIGIAFEHVLWRLPLLHGWFVKRPNLRGTWRVELQSDWINPATGEGVPLDICYMGVEQTLSTLQMHLMTKESESWFIADRIHPSPSGNGYQVVGVYTNKPQMHLRGDRSEMHQGAIVLETHGPDGHPETLTGEYWNDRKTTGSICFTSRISKVVTRFDDAARLFTAGKTPPPKI
jgi:hypothetical protein